MRIPALAICLVALAGSLPVAHATGPQANPASSVPSFTVDQWSSILSYSARQRMLSQKIAKEYFFIAANVQPDVYRNELRTSIQQFETAFNALRSGDPGSNIPAFTFGEFGNQFNAANNVWNQLKPVFTTVASGGTPDASTFTTVDTNVTQLLETLTNTGMLLTDAAQNQLGSGVFAQIVTTVGTQRTLSQRLAKDFTLVHLGVYPNSAQFSLREGASQFDESFNTLSTFGNTPAFSTPIATIRNAWNSFKPAITRGFNATPTFQDVQAVAQSNTNLLETTNLAFQQVSAAGKNTQITGVNTQGE